LSILAEYVVDAPTFPYFIWIVRDFHLARPPTPLEYLESALKPNLKRKDTINGFQRCFPAGHRECFLLPRPFINEEETQNITSASQPIPKFQVKDGTHSLTSEGRGKEYQTLDSRQSQTFYCEGKCGSSSRYLLTATS
jgi:hypothetical protein